MAAARAGGWTGAVGKREGGNLPAGTYHHPAGRARRRPARASCSHRVRVCAATLRSPPYPYA